MLKMLARLLFIAAIVAMPALGQTTSKIVFDAVADGQTGAMQTGPRAANVTFTFCGTGFSGVVYVDAASTSGGLAQVWSQSLTTNSDCTTTLTSSPATKWYRARWTRTAGALNVWMAIQTGDAPSTPRALGVFSSLTGKPGSSAVVLRYVATGPFSFPATMAPSYFVAGVAATAQTDFTIKKNGTTFVTARFAAAGTVATYVTGAATTFAAGDVLTVVAPAVVDTTLADLAITLSPTLP